MILLINTASTFKGGGVQVALSFIEECKNYPENTYHVVLGEVAGRLISRDTFPENFFFYDIGFRPATRLFSFRSHNRYFKKLEKVTKPDCVFTTSGPAYWRPRTFHLTGYNLPHHVYPDSPFFRIIHFYTRLRWFLKKQLHLYYFQRDSDAFVTQTEDVTVRLKKMLKTEKVYTVSNTFSTVFEKPAKVENRLALKANSEIRLLSLTAYHMHKNLEIIKAVVPILISRGFGTVRFVLTIDHDHFNKFFPQESRTNIINVGPVPVKQCPSLYEEIDFVFLPSLLECFSANYPEAMVMRKPVLTSDLGFARTVCGEAALYFDPLNPQDIADKIIHLITNQNVKEELVSKGIERLKMFPGACARAASYLDLCRQLIST